MDHWKYFSLPFDSVSSAPHTTRVHFKGTFDGWVVKKRSLRMATCRYADGTLQGVKLIWESWEVSASLTLPRIMPRKPYISWPNCLCRRCNCLEHNYERISIKRGSDLSFIECCNFAPLLTLKTHNEGIVWDVGPGVSNCKVPLIENSFALS